MYVRGSANRCCRVLCAQGHPTVRGRDGTFDKAVRPCYHTALCVNHGGYRPLCERRGLPPFV
jgi:hypothetical protein